ncbi:MAG: CDP-alcohol phosphatidyltransferase family protein, partial [Candidatus Hodarchaeota archaeon]
MSPSRFRVRGVFRGTVLRIASPLHRRGVRPDTISHFTLLLSLVAVLTLAILRSEPLFGLLVFFIGLLDGVDGAIARMQDSLPPAGGLVDSFVDKVAEALILFAVAITYPSEVILGVPVTIWTFFCLFGWLMTSYARARAESLGVKDLDIGLGARSERLFILVLFSTFSLLILGLVVVSVLGLMTSAY